MSAYESPTPLSLPVDCSPSVSEDDLDLQDQELDTSILDVLPAVPRGFDISTSTGFLPTGNTAQVYSDVARDNSGRRNNTLHHDIVFEDVLCTWPTIGRKRRYNRDPDSRIPFRKTDQWVFNPRSTLDNWDKLDGPKYWEVKAHPEGQPYYRSMRGSVRFLTEAKVHDSDVCEGIEQAIRSLGQKMNEEGCFRDTDNIEVVLVMLDDSGNKWSYYMIKHKGRSLFWLHHCDCGPLAKEFGGAVSMPHLKQRFEVEYWRHVEDFPHHFVLSKSVMHELLGVLSYNTIGSLTAPRESTCSFSPEEMQVYRDVIKLLNELKDMEHKSSSDPPDALDFESNEKLNSFVTSSTARLMALIGQERFANLHGQDIARLSRLQSIRQEFVKKRSLILAILSPLLFYAPDIHLRNIEDVWIDRMVLQDHWKDFIAKMVHEWEGLVLYSTVLLNANVAFLAIPDVSAPKGSLASPAEIASQLSMITSVGSVFISLLLARHHQLKEKSANEAAEYMAERGLETLAILYSLPYALLMWSMVSFVVSIAITCFDVPGITQRVVTGVGWFFIVVFVGWTAFTGWQDSKNSKVVDARKKAKANDESPMSKLSQIVKSQLDSLMELQEKQSENNTAIPRKADAGTSDLEGGVP